MFSLTSATTPVLETMINLTRALLYCVGERRQGQHVCPKIEGDWQCRWIPIRNLLVATGIPAYLVAANDAGYAQSHDAKPFDFAASVYSEEELSGILSEPSATNTTSVLIAGCYAETLITDVALSTLKLGYDTFVIWDRVWAISEMGLEAAKARLLQAGAVPTSVDQVLHRWS